MRRFVAAASVGALAAGLTIGPLACTASDPAEPDPDTDGDGLSDRVETEIYGTSPVLKDTDGDGWTDYEEIVGHAFDPANNPYLWNPRIADIPDLEVQFTSPPLIVIQLTDARGVVQSFQTSRSDTWTATTTDSRSATQQQTDSLTTMHTIGSDVSVTFAVAGAGRSGDAGVDGAVDTAVDAAVDAGADAGADAGEESGADGGAGGGVTAVTESNSVSDTVEPSTSDSVAITFSNDQSLGYSETLDAAQTYEQAHTITAISGEIKIAAVLVNRGHVGFKVISLELQAVAVEPEAEWPIGNLAPDPPNYTQYTPFALGPGQVSPLDFNRTALSLDEIAAIAHDSTAVRVRLSTFELDNAQGVSFAFALGEIAAKTALVVIDYGGKRPSDQFLVATNLDPAHPGVSVEKVFTDILRLPFEASSSGLTRIRDVGPAASSAGSWVVEHEENEGSQIAMKPYAASIGPYDLGQIVLHAGDVLHVVYLGP